MNQHPIYMTANSPRDVPSPHRHLETLTSDGASFQPIPTFHPQTTTYYSPAPTTFHVSSAYGHERKDYLTSSIHGLTPVHLPELSSALTGTGGSNMSSLPPLKEHPAAIQADQMNTYMEFFVDPDQGPSGQQNMREEHGADEDLIEDEHDRDPRSIMLNGLGGALSGMDEDERKRFRNSEVAKQRYHRLSEEQKREVNARRSDQMKKRRQAERERRELDDILRETKDLDDPEIEDRRRSSASKARRAEAARSRYQRMSEMERKQYNHRRRLKALGIDPDSPKAVDNPAIVKDTIRQANAKKAEAARQRYHRMSPEERRLYNQRRTESFRKRRVEEEILLSTPAGRISAEALQKAQQIMIRNARKAEAARFRYQKMTPEQRKCVASRSRLQEYNIRRAQSKKARSTMGGAATPSMMSSDCSIDSDDDLLGDSSLDLGSSFPSEPPANILDTRSEMITREIGLMNHQHALDHPPQPPRTAADDIFQQMERDVVKRTKQAQLTLARQRQDASNLNCTRFVNNQHDMMVLPQDISLNDPMLPPSGGGGSSLIVQAIHGGDHKPTGMYSVGVDHEYEDSHPSPNNQMMIDEKALHEMLMTGRDTNGMMVELRTMDGLRINEEHELRALTHHHPIVIHTLESMHENKEISIYINHNSEQQVMRMPQGHLAPSTSSQDSMYSNGIDDSMRFRSQVVVSEGNVHAMISSLSQSGGQNQMSMAERQMSMSERHELSKARRAERARARYHSMPSDIRQQQNARRAELLRKARQRDEQLVQMSDQVDSPDLTEKTRREILDATERRARRAEQARAKYHRMNSEERRQYNAMRDAQRRQRKRQQETRGRDGRGAPHGLGHSRESGLSDGPSNSGSLSPQRRDIEQVEEQIIYGVDSYGMYDQPMPGWE